VYGIKPLNKHGSLMVEHETAVLCRIDLKYFYFASNSCGTWLS